MKKIKFIILIVTGFLNIASFAQSLSYTDLLNLQKSDLEKAKGFFTYKGFTWSSSDKDIKNAFNRNGYDLSYDRVIWKNNSEEIQYLTKDGYETVIFYITNEYYFSELENEVKSKFKLFKTNTTENLFWTSYNNQNIQITFNTQKYKEYYTQKTMYSICACNSPDIDKRINLLCDNCKGKGQISEFLKCRYCYGDGKQNCDKCDGTGKIYCGYCKEGYTQCRNCGGNGTYKCEKCWGNGKLQCSKCYGQGSLQCSKCYGQGVLQYCPRCNGTGKVTETVAKGFLVTTYTCPDCHDTGKGNFTCKNCSGKGKLTCTNCSGVGSLTCENCSGKGTLTCLTCYGSGKVICQYCKGNYSETCTKCGGTGNTDLVCTNCNGKGTTNDEIKKVCSVCNGSKLKSSLNTIEGTRVTPIDNESKLKPITNKLIK